MSHIYLLFPSGALVLGDAGGSSVDREVVTDAVVDDEADGGGDDEEVGGGEDDISQTVAHKRSLFFSSARVDMESILREPVGTKPGEMINK